METEELLYFLSKRNITPRFLGEVIDLISQARGLPHEEMASALSSELSCPICLELFRDPVSLPCMHSYCRKCLESILLADGGRHVQCPECRNVTTLDGAGLQKLPRNFTIANIVAKYRSVGKIPQIPCDLCDVKLQQNAVKSCRECKLSYCMHCLILHPLRGVFSKHSLIEPQEFVSHEKKLVCLKCSKLAKEDDKLETCQRDHRNDVMDVKTAKLKLKSKMQGDYVILDERLRKYLQDIYKTTETLHGIMKNADTKRTKLKQKYHGKTEDILSKFKTDFKRIQDDFESGIKEVEVKGQGHLLQLKEASNHLHDILPDMKEMLEKTEKDLDYKELQELFSRVQKRVEERDLPNCVLVPPDFDVEKKVDKIFTKQRKGEEGAKSLGLDVLGSKKAIPQDVSSTKHKKAKVLYDYEPEDEDELKIDEGDIVDIFKQEEEGWWKGSLNGKVGVFPSNFVEIIEVPEPEETDKPPAVKVTVLSCKCNPRKTGEGASITVSWQFDRRLSMETKYEIKFMEIADNDPAHVIIVRNIGIPSYFFHSSFTVNQLQPNVTYNVTVTVQDRPETESESTIVHTLQGVQCEPFSLSSIEKSKDTRLDMTHKCLTSDLDSADNTNEFERAFGVCAGTIILNNRYSSVYWEVELSFHLRGVPNNNYVLCTGICAEEKLDVISNVVENYFFYGISLGKDEKGQPKLWIYDGGEMVRELPVKGERHYRKRYGFFYNADQPNLVVVDGEKKYVLLSTGKLKKIRYEICPYRPVFRIGHNEGDPSIKIMTGSDITEIPKCLLGNLYLVKGQL